MKLSYFPDADGIFSCLRLSWVEVHNLN